jgi:hypothetical protein
VTKTLILASSQTVGLVEIITENHRGEKTFIAAFSQGNLQLLTLFGALETICKIGLYDNLEFDLNEGDTARLKSALAYYRSEHPVIASLKEVLA